MSPLASIHKITASRYPPLRSGLPAWVTCECGVTVSAPAALAQPDPHAPLSKAWAEHRSAVGLKTPTVTDPGSTGDGWDGSWTHAAIGNSRRSARQGGLMGVAAKRAAAKRLVVTEVVE